MYVCIPPRSGIFQYHSCLFCHIQESFRLVPAYSCLFRYIPLYLCVIPPHSGVIPPVYSGIFRSVPVFSNTRHADHFQVPSQLLYSIRPVPNVVLLPCRTQMNLAWQWHDDGTAAVSNVEPNMVAPNSKDKTNHPSSVIVCK